MIEAYFDESGSHQGSPLLSVGGYIFERDQCDRFDAAWRKMLQDFEVPFMHMTACEGGDYPYEKLPRELRDAMAGRAARIINSHMAYSVIIAVNESEFDEIETEESEEETK